VRRLAALVLVVGVTVVAAPAARGDDGGVAAARSRANRAAAQLAAAESKADELATKAADLQGQADTATAAMADLLGSLQTLAVARYVSATRPQELLADVDINRHVEADALLRLVKEGDEGTVDQFKAEKADLDAAQAALATTLKDQQAAVKDLKAKRAAVDAELQKLEAAEKAKAAAAAAASAGTHHGSGVPIATGAWVCPVQGARAFSDDFGQPRSGGRRHQGNDILSPRGTPVVVPVSGTVTRRDNDLGGISFWEVGDDGNAYYGAHMDYWAGVSGHVSAGTQVGGVGNTGDARGGPTHLHFEIHPGGGGAIDPYATLRKYC
jgi:murein DD-endopeptidase MepM/ murein hydrolase activator NlpD